MPGEAPHRISLTEYESDSHALGGAAAATGRRIDEVVALFDAANQRLLSQLGSVAPPIVISGNTVRVENIAGLLRLSPQLELEIAPKFLGQSWASWRGDFFVVATLSRFGHFMPADLLRSGIGDRGDLATVVGKAMVTQFWRNLRRPLRAYETKTWESFTIEGDFDPEEIAVPPADGFRQSGISLTRSNPLNAVITAAIGRLLGEITDAETRQHLARVRNELAPQQRIRRIPRRRILPGRHRRWQLLYDLSIHVLEGFGIELADSVHRAAPGFIVRTPKAWEDVLTAAMRYGAPDAEVLGQHKHALGTRNGEELPVRPDMTITLQDGTLLLADAKYKGREGEPLTRASASDVYESLAFLRAADAKRLILVFPAPAREGTEVQDLGQVTLTETVMVEDMEIEVVEVECRGLSRRNGFREFSSRMAEQVLMQTVPVV